MGTSDAPIEDEALIAEEKLRKEAVESEDAGAGWDAEALHACGMRVDLLLAMTFSLNLWEWKTWEVVQFLVKPATESRNRCRFIDLAEFRPYKGPSKVVHLFFNLGAAINPPSSGFHKPLLGWKMG